MGRPKFKPDQDSEAMAIQIKQAETEVFVAQCAAAAQDSTKAWYKWLASLWGKSEAEVTDFMAIHFLFASKGLVHASYPLRLYRTAIRTNDPRHWLQMATDTEYRAENGMGDERNIWSTRQLEDAAGIAKGKKVSAVSWLKGRAKVGTCREGYVELNISGWIPTGDKPVMLEIDGKEILK